MSSSSALGENRHMTPQEFIAKWGPGGPAYGLNERQGVSFATGRPEVRMSSESSIPDLFNGAPRPMTQAAIEEYLAYCEQPHWVYRRAPPPSEQPAPTTSQPQRLHSDSKPTPVRPASQPQTCSKDDPRTSRRRRSKKAAQDNDQLHSWPPRTSQCDPTWRQSGSACSLSTAIIIRSTVLR